MEENNNLAVVWFKKAAEQGHHRAEFFLGECHENGYGVPKNPAKAVEYYTKAHEGGRSDGSFALAACYEHGLGVKADQKKALELYREAARRGSKEAEEAVKWLSTKKAIRFPWMKK